MKLYTEEQVIEAMTKCFLGHNNMTDYDYELEYKILKELTPIELPSDEEIEKEVIKHFQTPLNKKGEPMTQLVGHNPYGFNKFKKTFTKGYKAALEQILNQNK